MRAVLSCIILLLATPALAQEVFHGWSKDGTWLVFERQEANDLVELHFCATNPEVPPTWPKELNAMEREEGRLSCVRFIDVNKAPYEWKQKVQLPTPANQANGIKVHAELVTDGETPGFALEAGDKLQVCYASGMRESSKLQKTWFHPSGRYAAAQIDGNFHHCIITLKPAKPPGKKK
ncbi:MAG: hypothetical protein AMXMBFR34_00720 [Myxococcaceae bacterium]